MKTTKKVLSLAVATAVLTLQGCAIEFHESIQTEKAVQSNQTVTRDSTNTKVPVAIGQFANHSTLQNVIFAGEDKLGSQAEAILLTYLQQAGCYLVLDRNNMKALAQESNFNKKSQHIKGARYIVTGDIVEFGHRNVGDKQLFGIIGKGKRQQAYAKVILNIVDTESSAVVYYVPPCIAKID